MNFTAFQNAELNIHRSTLVWDMVDGAEYEFDLYDTTGPQQKIKELEAKGHNTSTIDPTSSEFKEYIRRLREQAQIPEKK